MVNVEEVCSGRKGGEPAGHVGKIDDVRQVLQMILHLVLDFLNLLQLGGVFLKWNRIR